MRAALYLQIALSLALTLCLSTSCKNADDDAVKQTAKVTQGEHWFEGVYYGELIAAKSTDIHVPDIPDTWQVTVDSVKDDGVVVKEGEVILTFVRETLELDLRDEDEKLEVARAERLKVVQQLDKERIDLELDLKRKQLNLDRAKLQVVEGVNLIEALGQVDELLQTFGGHTVAAGLALSAEHIDEFRSRLPLIVSHLLNDQPLPAPVLRIDAIVDLDELNDELLDALSSLAPFGMGNPEPVFMSRPQRASKIQIIGKRHLRARFYSHNQLVEAFGYNLSESRELLEDPVVLAYVPKLSVRRGKAHVELRIKDLRAHQVTLPDQTEHIDLEESLMLETLATPIAAQPPTPTDV